MKKTLASLLLAACASCATVSAVHDSFDWDGATVYFVITDRFCNGDTTNDVNYGRITDYGSERLNAATFHGGDFKGMLKKAREGYFTDLGIDVVWMTDVYEQIHGWMSGSGPVNDFPHYGYHGYYPLDYTQTDKNYGSIAELRELVDTLHSQGIRVMLGANLNDPGYPTLLDAVQYGFAETGLSEAEAALHRRDWSYDGFFAGREKWTGWYDGGWIRMPGEGWDENDPLQATLYGMPDFKDESDAPVAIPGFLHRKWEAEGRDNDQWVNPSARKLRIDRQWSPMQYVIAWIASWVEELGIDGVRCDIVENVHLNRWKELSEACNEALTRWRRNHPDDPAAQWTDRFYMTGDFDGASIDFKPDYADAGFSSMVNFYFPKHGDLDGIVYTWQAYADSLQAHDGWHPFSYLNNSYHRDADMTNMIDCATTLLLAPGVAQVFYGDETGRTLSDARLNVDSDQAFRSDMNWEEIDSLQLAHFRRLGQIRRDNPVIATGHQRTLDTHTALRYDPSGNGISGPGEATLASLHNSPSVSDVAGHSSLPIGSDSIIIRLCPAEDRPIDLYGTFPDGTTLTDLCTGERAVVTRGTVSFPRYLNKVAILRRE